MGGYYLGELRALIDGGYDVNVLGGLRDRLEADQSDRANAAIVWALEHCDDPTTIWWLGAIAGRRGPRRRPRAAAREGRFPTAARGSARLPRRCPRGDRTSRARRGGAL